MLNIYIFSIHNGVNELLAMKFSKRVFQKVAPIALGYVALGIACGILGEKAGINHEEIDFFVPHQANLRIINALGRKLGLPEDRVVVTVDKHANTSAASVPLAFDEACRDGRIKEGQLVLLQGVGGGFTWGSVLVRV